VTLRVAGREMTIKFVKTFSDVPVGQPLLYLDSRGRLAMAVNQNNFAATYGVKVPSEIEIPRAK
jgi:S-adenosylmethionine hydrolase